ncbi:MAG: hypothetical protein AB1724_10805 [Thermodesulfobacteriota bacterium]
MKKYSFLLILSIAMLLPMNGYTWNDEITHPNITKNAVRFSNADKYLQSNFGFTKSGDPKQPGTFFKGQYVTELISKGAMLEDDPICRASNHFHNPLSGWGDSELTDTRWLTELWCWGFGMGQYPPGEIASNITWQLDICRSTRLLKIMKFRNPTSGTGTVPENTFMLILREKILMG